jgi:hypothetical protein
MIAPPEGTATVPVERSRMLYPAEHASPAFFVAGVQIIATMYRVGEPSVWAPELLHLNTSLHSNKDHHARQHDVCLHDGSPNGGS